MPRTFQTRTPLEALLVEQDLLLARQLQKAADDAPDGQEAATKFLDGLEALSREAKDPSLTGVVPKWGTMGATASEFVRHVAQHNLQIAPAPVGAEEAYSALHRGLAGYYAALARVQK
jgi:hypothetical protein